MMEQTNDRDDLVAETSDLSRVAVVIPTFNGARYWDALHTAIGKQGIAPHQVLVVDSCSSDGTRAMAESAGYKVISVQRSDFDHGGTRRMACENLAWADTLICMTQDAIPADPESFRRLARAFDNPAVGAAYGRQMPRKESNPIERHARLFNYPSESAIRTYASREQYGLKAPFISNSFAAYRLSALNHVGGFPEESIVGEESVVACRLLIDVADSVVVHSHAFTLRKEFARYFDIGVHHAREPWILDHFGHAREEGKRFMRSELSYLLAEDAFLIPVAVVRTFVKLFAYQAGRRERYIPHSIKAKLSGQKAFWKHKQVAPKPANEPAQPAVAVSANAKGWRFD
jgi:rhamnosyltransferase